MRETGNGPQGALWPTRYLTNGRIAIARQPVVSGGQRAVEAAAGFGRGWRRLPRWGQWVLAFIAAALAQNAFGEPAGLVVLALLGLVLLVTTMSDANRWYDRTQTPEAELSVADSPEARVAGAASRAWQETLAEPSWFSPHLAATRASFNGRQEVDTIIDLALRIHTARKALGAEPPPGPARDYWRQQTASLNRSAYRLGDRADALIRHRDQAAALSAELHQLAELERLERSALLVDDITVQTSFAPEEPGVLPVSEQIRATRQAIAEIIDTMVRTRAPLAEGPPPTLP